MYKFLKKNLNGINHDKEKSINTLLTLGKNIKTQWVFKMKVMNAKRVTAVIIALEHIMVRND